MAINITASGVVEYDEMREDGHWRTTILPGDTTTAETLLTGDELAQVQAAWTEEVLEAWADLNAEVAPEEGPVPPTQDERLAALENAMLELLLGGF